MCVSGAAEMQLSISVIFFHSKSHLKTRIQEVIGSNIGWGASSSDRLSLDFLNFRGKFQDSASARPCPLHSKSFPVHQLSCNFMLYTADIVSIVK
jgi:hypothetical protein